MKLSIILPTYNNEKTIRECLESIQKQDFKDYEILLIDGGSDDNTKEIAKEFNCKILKNPYRVEEKARIQGINKAKGEVIVLIDADNVIPEKDFFNKMLEPFEDKEIAFSESLYYSYRKNDKLGVRYQALIGGDDPIVGYLGFYSRWNYFKGDWTGYPYFSEDKGNYLKIIFKDKKKVPPMGCNGFFVRKKIAKKLIKDKFIHSDFIYDLVNKGYNCFAKVKKGIIHNQPKFFPNKLRRMKRRKSLGIKYDYGMSKWRIFLAVLYVGLFFPLFIDTIRGFIKKPDSAWLFHIPASYLLLLLYIYYNLFN